MIEENTELTELNEDDAVTEDPAAGTDAPETEQTLTEGDVRDGGSRDEQADEVDYGAVIESDLKELRAQFPELRGIADITELSNPLRYAALRDLGLTPREAYLATSDRPRRPDNRAHLSVAVPRGAGEARGGMSREELLRARELFSGMSDTELQSLYRKVNA